MSLNSKETKNSRLSPFNPKVSILISIFCLVALFLLLGTFRHTLGWSMADSDSTILIGILIVSLLPIILIIVDTVIERGGKFEYGDFKIDFSKVESKSIADFTVSANIGVRGQPVTDSLTTNIVSALRDASANSIVIIDIEDSEAWWETRLLVLLSGAVRLGCPDKIVFVANQSGKTQHFVGWANTNELLKYLLQSDLKYKRAYLVAKAILEQWDLVVPQYPIPPQNNALIPDDFPWMQSDAKYKKLMAFDNNTGLLNDFFPEQLLQNELGREIEQKERAKRITLLGLSNLPDKVLNRNHVDKNWTNEEQMKCYFIDDAPFIAITENGIYLSLVSRFAIFNEVVKKLATKTSDK